MATDGNFRMSQGDRRVGLQALACFDEDSDYAYRGDGAAKTSTKFSPWQQSVRSASRRL